MHLQQLLNGHKSMIAAAQIYLLAASEIRNLQSEASPALQAGADFGHVCRHAFVYAAAQTLFLLTSAVLAANCTGSGSQTAEDISSGSQCCNPVWDASVLI